MFKGEGSILNLFFSHIFDMEQVKLSKIFTLFLFSKVSCVSKCRSKKSYKKNEYVS